MKAAKVHRCKLHGYAHAYTVCPACSCQYCPEHWPACPRTSWHPAHGTTPADVGARYGALRAGRRDQLETKEGG